MNVRFLDVKRIHHSIQDELNDAVSRAVRSGWYILGPEVEAFESEWAEYVGARYCVSVGNGLDALVLTLRALGVGAGDEVVVPSHTFVATWLAVAACGATPVGADVDAETYNVTPDGVSRAITSRTRAVIPVHLYGAPLDGASIAAAAGPAIVVEDAAQAHGARWAQTRIGGAGRTACWSFYPGKNLGALGDAGAVTTDDKSLADCVRLLRNYGSSRKYVHEQAGVNSRLDELQAAALRVKLRHLDTWNSRRGEIAAAYGSGLSEVIATPSTPEGAEPVWHLYVVRSPDRDRLAARLAERGVETLIHYPTPPHRQAAFACGDDFPIADTLASEVLSLPMGPHLSDDEVAYVVDAVRASV